MFDPYYDWTEGLTKLSDVIEIKEKECEWTFGLTKLNDVIELKENEKCGDLSYQDLWHLCHQLLEDNDLLKSKLESSEDARNILTDKLDESDKTLKALTQKTGKLEEEVAEFNPDYQLIIQTIENGDLLIEDRTSYLVSCKHNESNTKGHNVNAVKRGRGKSWDEYHFAGECLHCRRDALQRLKAVAKGHFSISINRVIPRYGCAASSSYVNDDGVIVHDIFKTYSKPDMRQMLQFLMSNPADLHPAVVAEDQNLYWTIVWYWGSVFRAIEDTCSRNILEAIYQRLGDKITLNRNGDASSLAAFSESATREWRIASGSEDCPRVDKEVEFNVCSGCKVKRYCCNDECQKKDWAKHKQFCKPVEDQ